MMWGSGFIHTSTQEKPTHTDSPASKLLSQQVNHQTVRKLHTYGTVKGGWYPILKLILGADCRS